MWKSKTSYAGLAGIISSLGLFMSSEISLAEFLNATLTSTLAIFLRHGIHKTQNVAEAAVEAASSVTPAPKKKVVKKKD